MDHRTMLTASLFQAAELLAQQAPAMALNLDMGSYNYCIWVRADGTASSCGALGIEGTDKLSNLIRLTARP